MYFSLLQAEFEDMEDDDDWDCSGGARILGISYSPDREEASYAALISPEGEVVDYVKLSYLLASRSGLRCPPPPPYNLYLFFDQ
jgi:hypothetical protein